MNQPLEEGSRRCSFIRLSLSSERNSFYFVIFNYRPQRNWGKVMFSQACVILFTGGGLSQYMLGYPGRCGHRAGGIHPTGMQSCFQLRSPCVLVVHNYHLQTKFAKVMFLHLSVSHSVHREGVCLRACWDIHPPGQTPPLEQTPPRADPPWEQTPPGGRHPPGSRYPLGADPPRADTPRAVHAGR